MKICLVISVVFFTTFALGHDVPVDKRVYTFAVGQDDPPFEIAAQDGKSMGFTVDIARRVCEKAGKKCVFVGYSKQQDCWNSETRTSNALNNRYWDVCATKYKTIERALGYGFFGVFSTEQPSFLYTRNGASIRNYDAANHRTGFHKGAWLSESCLRRNGMDVKNVSVYDTMASLLNDVKGGRIDVGFFEEGAAEKAGGLRKISNQIKCAMTGNSMMVRKEDVPAFEWFDTALKDVVKSPYYKWACNIARRGYGSNPHCFK